MFLIIEKLLSENNKVVVYQKKERNELKEIQKNNKSIKYLIKVEVFLHPNNLSRAIANKIENFLVFFVNVNFRRGKTTHTHT